MLSALPQNNFGAHLGPSWQPVGGPTQALLLRILPSKIMLCLHTRSPACTKLDLGWFGTLDWFA